MVGHVREEQCRAPTSVNNSATYGCSPAWRKRREPPVGAGKGHQEMETATARTDLAVVGGGMAGLTAACYLARSGANVALFGRTPSRGGRAATRTMHTSRTDRGSA